MSWLEKWYIAYFKAKDIFASSISTVYQISKQRFETEKNENILMILQSATVHPAFLYQIRRKQCGRNYCPMVSIKAPSTYFTVLKRENDWNHGNSGRAIMQMTKRCGTYVACCPVHITAERETLQGSVMMRLLKIHRNAHVIPIQFISSVKLFKNPHKQGYTTMRSENV